MAEVRKTSETRKIQKSTDPETKYVSYWLTRERRGGVLADRVEIWLVKPERLRFGDGDVMWLAPASAVDRAASYYGEWTIEEAQRHVGSGAPSNDRECLRVGGSDDPVS